ncbi:DUF4362 domain-containing protein [Paenibacillus marchantiae]|uniref:DUF4362 domain-containing protein n=1 Tax=Paenibacillus marchantiae TaxID=3026433 RepID=UPI00237ACD76|nr:DUF4362 domain-containing protein [Paenibacillus marchantiae]WDQ34538.1 DUF4362 domain-containing protein [Paenibacillus marchantiae]
MKRVLLTLLLALIMLTACEANDPTVDSPVVLNSFPEIIEPHNPEQAEQSGDAVVLLEGMRNKDKWKTFVKNVKNKQQDQVRVTMYTIEGGAIIHELIYDGSAIQATYDNSRDAYGSKQGITTNTCQGIGTKSEQGRVFNVLTGCEKAGSTFSIPK